MHLQIYVPRAASFSRKNYQEQKNVLVTTPDFLKLLRHNLSTLSYTTIAVKSRRDVDMLS